LLIDKNIFGFDIPQNDIRGMHGFKGAKQIVKNVDQVIFIEIAILLLSHNSFQRRFVVVGDDK
jgi:hypothetical protein